MNPAHSAKPAKPVWWLRLLGALPWSVLYAFTAVLAWLARYLVRFKLSIVRDNLSRCFPQASAREINALVNAYYRQLGQVVAEIFKTTGLSREQIGSHFTRENFEGIDAELAAGRSIIVLGSHQGNWEWGLHGITLSVPVQVDAAYKPLHDARSDRELRLQRGRYGANLIAAKRLLREVIARQRQVVQHCVGMHADQMPTSSQRRHWLTFLGRETAFYPGPGEIARVTGYAAFFMAVRRMSRGRYRLIVQPLAAAQEKLDPAVFTARYAAAVEAEIRVRPSDWTWLHRRWKGEPPPDSVAAPPAREARQ